MYVLCLKLWKMIKVFIRYLHTLISTTCCQLQGTSSLWILDQGGAAPLDPTEASSQTILQARSTTIVQILPSYIIPSRSLWSSSTTISAPLRKTSIATSISFSSTTSDVWDVSCPPMFPLPRHCKFSEGKHQGAFIPSCLPWIHYTDHQNRSVL